MNDPKAKNYKQKNMAHIDILKEISQDHNN